ncbi:phospholipase C [Aphelenchoides avenae]|nr:phospholipase C [Aphelenchus avenae]
MYASCYQVTSLTEASARKLCRKHAHRCISYTRKHIMRTYPGGMRIDSSNFNPLQFWQFGLQMVALNYQTADVPMAVNAAMFEQSGNCGYMLKPRALWDPTHPLYAKFNPLSKDLSDSSALILQITVSHNRGGNNQILCSQVISGQYVCPGQFNASPFLEIEVIGVPADCCKEKSKIIGRNSLNSVNPIWNYSATFRITFVDLAFLRIAVCDGAANGKCLSQRVVPIKCLRPGYRHLPLRTPSNQPLEQSTLFLRTRFEQEEHIYLHDDDTNHYPNYEPELAYQILKIDPEAQIKPLSILRKQIFVLRIHYGSPEDPPVVVQCESGSLVRQVVQTALINAGKSENADDYLLFEESLASSANSPVSTENTDACSAHYDEQPISRMLPHNEPIMDAVACWNGSTRRFYLRKKTADASGRAWITSIIKSGNSSSSTGVVNPVASTSTSPSFGQRRGAVSPTIKSHSSIQLHGRSMDVDGLLSNGDYLEPGMHPRAKSMGETFLVCIHNVSDNHPYAILRTSVKNSAEDVIKQIFTKTQRYDNEKDYVLVEELRESVESVRLLGGGKASFDGTARKPIYRVLEPDENVWKVQSSWSAAGRFLLERRDELPTFEKTHKLDTHARKISLSNVRSIGLPKKISRFGKSLTLDNSAKNGNA